MRKKKREPKNDEMKNIPMCASTRDSPAGRELLPKGSMILSGYDPYIRNNELGGLFSWNCLEEAFNLSHHLTTRCYPIMFWP
jgi:hypothetical protein